MFRRSRSKGRWLRKRYEPRYVAGSGERPTESGQQTHKHRRVKIRLPKSYKPSLPLLTRSSFECLEPSGVRQGSYPDVRVSMTNLGFVLVRRMYTREGRELQRFFTAPCYLWLCRIICAKLSEIRGLSHGCK